MYKKCKLVLLPTDKAENSILITACHNVEYYGEMQYFTQMYLKDNGIRSYHLYVKSTLNNPKIEYRIIATTNKDLGLPLIPKEFIELYVNLYNRNSQITTVSVEFNSSSDNLDDYIGMFGGQEIGDTLKVVDNHIIIKEPIREQRKTDIVEILMRQDFIKDYGEDHPIYELLSRRNAEKLAEEILTKIM